MGGLGPEPGFFDLFNVVQVLFPIAFVAILAVVLIRAFKGIGQWSYNNKQPVLSVRSRIVAKRMNVSHRHRHSDGAMHSDSSTTYYVTFEVESGDRMEMTVEGREYGMLAEDDIGKLTFQGTRYLGFEREN